MSKQAFHFKCYIASLFILCLVIFSACESPADDVTQSDTSPKTQVEFTNLEQYSATVYSDPARQVVFAEVAANGTTKVDAMPAPAGIAFYPTFHLDIFDMPDISIPYNATHITAMIEDKKTAKVPIPKLESIVINSAYIKIKNDSDFSLALRQGNTEILTLDSRNIIVMPGQSAIYEVTPGSVSSYTFMRNVSTPVEFPAGLSEFKSGIIYSFTYTNTGLALTAQASVLQILPPAVPENVRAEVLSNSSVSVTWDEVYGATSYRVYRAAGSATASYSRVTNTAMLSWIDTGVTAGEIYYYKVSALSGGNMESAQSAVVSALVMQVDNVRISAVTDSSVSLAWDAVNGANSYNVYRSDSENGTYTKVNHSTISGAGYTDTGLDPLTEYYYKVSATAFDLEGILSGSVSCTTLKPAPSNVQLTSVTDGSISFTWNAVNDASGYNIYRSSSVDGIYTRINSSMITQVSYADTGLSSNTNYHYKVSAVNDDIESAQSSVLSVATLLPVPENLRITAVTDISVSLAWNTVTGASGYNVYRSESEDGTYTKINPFVITAVSYTDTGVSPETNYYYNICAVSSEGVEGIRSNTVSVATPISAPDNLRVTSVTDNGISLAWNTVNNASGYNIYRSNSVNGTYTKLNSSLITNVTYADTGLVSNTGYYYKVSVMVDGVESIHSNATSGTTLLSAPVNLRVIAVTDVSVSLEWNTVTRASGYNVYRSDSENGSYTKVNTSVITVLSYTNTGVSPDTTYYYKVCAVSSGGIEGVQSSAISAATLIPAPGNVRVTAVTVNSVSLAWNVVSVASGYNVYRSNSANGIYNRINTGAVTGTTFTDTNVSAYTTYFYKVSAIINGIESMQSSPVSASTSIIPGSGLAAKLNWLQTNAVSNVDYIIEVTASESIGPTTLSYSNRTNISITLRGTGTARTVRLSSNGAMFTVDSGVTLVLDNNITLQGRSDNNDSLVRVNVGGTLVMNTGSRITGNTSSLDGGGVYVGGTFTMNGGTISSNTASSGGGGVYVGGNFSMNGGTISSNTASGCGGVYVYGGTFTMNGGTISSNTASSGSGGGVGVYRGTFTMNSGTISSNTAFSDNAFGGGVGVSGEGTFIMSGGTVSGNTASGNTVSYGGGVYMGGGTFTMSGGTISSNTAFSSNTFSLSRGGGVFMDTYGNFTMSGGTISGNTASGSVSHGGGVLVLPRGTFNKTGGTIYGYSSNTSNSNVVKNSSGAVQSNRGHAVYVDSSPVKRRETTAGTSVNLSFNGSNDTFSGGWD